MGMKHIDDVGTIRYFNKKGFYHRTKGPAVEYLYGYKSYWSNGQLHRTNGPARIWPDGTKHWHLNGKRLTEEQFKELTPKEGFLKRILKALSIFS